LGSRLAMVHLASLMVVRRRHFGSDRNHLPA